MTPNFLVSAVSAGATLLGSFLSGIFYLLKGVVSGRGFAMILANGGTLGVGFGVLLLFWLAWRTSEEDRMSAAGYRIVGLFLYPMAGIGLGMLTAHDYTHNQQSVFWH